MIQRHEMTIQQFSILLIEKGRIMKTKKKTHKKHGPIFTFIYVNVFK